MTKEEIQKLAEAYGESFKTGEWFEKIRIDAFIEGANSQSKEIEENSIDTLKSSRHPNKENKCISHSFFKEEWNTLSDRVKNYISSLEQRCDPSGEIQMIGSLTEQRDALIEKDNEFKERVSLVCEELRRAHSKMENCIDASLPLPTLGRYLQSDLKEISNIISDAINSLEQ